MIIRASISPTQLSLTGHRATLRKHTVKEFTRSQVLRCCCSVVSKGMPTWRPSLLLRSKKVHQSLRLFRECPKLKTINATNLIHQAVFRLSSVTRLNLLWNFHSLKVISLVKGRKQRLETGCRRTWTTFCPRPGYWRHRMELWLTLKIA